MRRLVLGTRGSRLALWQARHVAARLREIHPGLEIEERIVRTEGDDSTGWIGQGEDRGVFVRAIEERLARAEIDLAVHSLKDLPTSQPDGLVVAAVPQRHDPADVLLTADGWTIETLPGGSTVATGSPRRRCQLLHARPDLRVVGVRGNVDTRIGKLQAGQFDALVLARAGVERLGLDSVPAQPIPFEVCLPAVGQGALAIEVRADDREARDGVASLADATSEREVAAERAFLRRLGGGCLAPATGFARVAEGAVHLRAVVGDANGRRLLRDEQRGDAAEAEQVGELLAERMLDRGAGELLAESRRAAGRPAKP